MLKIEGKTFMNIQEAVQWLLENNALPFQCTANYAPNTEIGLGTIVNPSPAKVRIGSLIFFADSKVSTVTGITENGFIVSDQYNNLVDDVAYVTNVAINASGHLITTMSDGQTIDAGLIKQVASFSIDASQHLIVTYNDGTTADLGAIFSGNVTISGTLTVAGLVDVDDDIHCKDIVGRDITGASIIEQMSGYTFDKMTETTNLTREFIYAGMVKNGNKLTGVVALNITRTGSVGGVTIGRFYIPASVLAKIYPSTIGGYDYVFVKTVEACQSDSGIESIQVYSTKGTSYISIGANASPINALTINTKYYVRVEFTILLSENLAS